MTFSTKDGAKQTRKTKKTARNAPQRSPAIGFCIDEITIDPVVNANGTTKTRLVTGYKKAQETQQFNLN